jgi:hypothetical protein
MEDSLQTSKLAANILNKQSWTEKRRWTATIGAGRGNNDSLQ